VGLSRERRAGRIGWVCLLLGSVACSVGHGEGEVTGTVTIANCLEGNYQLHPTVFFAESAEELLKIRIQRGSDVEVRSDGLSVLVEDAALVKRMYLDQSVQVALEDEPRIDLSIYLNETCPAERDRTPVALAAVSGTVRFTAIYAPEVRKNQVRIAAELTNVRFEDPRVEDRFALLTGHFDFLYVRGSPAQRFP
jgi:hypothetical protein